MKKKLLQIPLDDQELVDLYQLILDRDADEALAFLQKHARSQVRDLLDNRAKVKVSRLSDEPGKEGEQ
jgi:hypothetical protein